MSHFSEEQTHQLMEALQAAGFTPDHVTKLGQYLDLSKLSLLLGGQAKIIVESTIRVDRTTRPTYPNWVKKVVRPELETTGPAEYDLRTVEKWQMMVSERGDVTGQILYDRFFMGQSVIIENHLGLADLIAIQGKGVAFFQYFFQGSQIFGWKSVVENDHHRLFVPSLSKKGKRIMIRWRDLSYYWTPEHLALFFGPVA